VYNAGLEALLVQCKDNMTPDDINRVLTEEEGHAFDGDILDFYNGLYGIEVSVQHEAGRQARDGFARAHADAVVQRGARATGNARAGEEAGLLRVP
jgi:hypothetical protein